MFVGVSEVGNVFDRGVERLGHPDEADGEDNGDLLAGSDLKPPPEDDDHDSREKVDAGVDFTPEQRGDAAEGTGEAFGFARDESAAVGHDDKL